MPKNHKKKCKCGVCKAIRGEYIKENHPSYKKGKPECKVCGNELSNYTNKYCSKCWYNFAKGKNAVNYKDGKCCNEKIKYCIDCGKKLSKKADYYNSKRCKLCHNRYLVKSGKTHQKGKFHSQYKDGRTLKKYFCKCGKEIKYNVKRCWECYLKWRIGKYTKNKHWNWAGGLNKQGYPIEFNEIIKEYIRGRDNYTCQLCNKIQKQELKDLKKKLSIHHIDYNKQNCDKENLITSCQRCNNKMNFNRDYYYAYCIYIIERS